MLGPNLPSVSMDYVETVVYQFFQDELYYHYFNFLIKSVHSSQLNMSNSIKEWQLYKISNCDNQHYQNEILSTGIKTKPLKNKHNNLKNLELH